MPADHEAHSRPQRGQLRRDECRSHSRVVTTLTELWRDRDPEAEAATRRSRADELTIAGSQAEQSLKRGTECRACRPSRQRLQRRGVPSDVQKWTTRGTAGTTTMPTVRWPTELWTGPEHPSSGAARCLKGRGEIFLSTCEDTACE